MIWTRVAYAGIELISTPAYAKRCNARPNYFLYALPVATLSQAYIVNRPLLSNKMACIKSIGPFQAF